MGRPRKDSQNRLVQTTIDDPTYRALCEMSIKEDRPIASVVRQAINLYIAHLERIRKVELI
jgi:hypothetical protein